MQSKLLPCNLRISYRYYNPIILYGEKAVGVPRRKLTYAIPAFTRASLQDRWAYKRERERDREWEIFRKLGQGRTCSFFLSPPFTLIPLFFYISLCTSPLSRVVLVCTKKQDSLSTESRIKSANALSNVSCNDLPNYSSLLYSVHCFSVLFPAGEKYSVALKFEGTVRSFDVVTW